MSRADPIAPAPAPPTAAARDIAHRLAAAGVAELVLRRPGAPPERLLAGQTDLPRLLDALEPGATVAAPWGIAVWREDAAARGESAGAQGRLVLNLPPAHGPGRV